MLGITRSLLSSASLYISITSVSANGVGLLPIPSVSLSVRKVYCGKMADWVRMPFGMMSGVGQGMGVLDGGGDRQRGRGILGLNLGRPTVANGDFAA